jgi:hypothetical protein
MWSVPNPPADVCFAICEACGWVDEVDDRRLRQFVDDWCEAEGFLLSRTAVELIGTCAPCLRAVALSRIIAVRQSLRVDAPSIRKPTAVSVRRPMSPLRLGLATRLAYAGSAAGVLWLAVLWAIS